jgi:hypothetical protein
MAEGCASATSRSEPLGGAAGCLVMMLVSVVLSVVLTILLTALR